MGIYSEYLDRQLNVQQLQAERKLMLQRITQLRAGRDILVFAADLQKGRLPIAIGHADLLPISDQLSNLPGSETGIDLILETPGGSGEVAEDIVKLIRGQYESMGVIVPGIAKSAGTIMAMAADEILLEPASPLGPIDAQIGWQGKVFSAHALLEGMDKIKKEVDREKKLNLAYVPILQNISPGELQNAQNALDFAKELVTEWLATYKFKFWDKHSSTRQPVTEEEKRTRASEIAAELCDHGRWKTHSRSIKIVDLEAMGLQVTDYSNIPELFDAIRRYYTLLKMSFDSNCYKIIETPTSQILRFERVQGIPISQAPGAKQGEFDIKCNQCGSVVHIQVDFEPGLPLMPGRLPFPADNKLRCACGAEHDLSEARRQIESQAKRQIVIRRGHGPI